MKKIISLVIPILVISSVFLYFKTNKTAESIKYFAQSDISSATNITCTYPQVLSTSYLDSKISLSLPKPETNPIINTFSELKDPKFGKMSYIDATQTITTAPVAKFQEDQEKIVYIDAGDNYFVIYTIYKKLGVSTYSKSVSLIGIPSGSLSMGTCVGY